MRRLRKGRLEGFTVAVTEQTPRAGLRRFIRLELRRDQDGRRLIAREQRDDGALAEVHVQAAEVRQVRARHERDGIQTLRLLQRAQLGEPVIFHWKANCRRRRREGRLDALARVGALHDGKLMRMKSPWERHPAEVLSEADMALIAREAEIAWHIQRLTPALVDLFIARRWLRVFVPREVGGDEWDWPQALALFEAVSWADGGVGCMVLMPDSSTGIARSISWARYSILLGKHRVRSTCDG